MKVFNLSFLLAAACAFSSILDSAQAGSIVLGETKSLSSPAAVTQTAIEFYLDRTGTDDGTPLSVGNFQLRVALTGAGAGSSVRILTAAATTAHAQAFALDTTSVTAGTSAYAATLNFASPFDVADGAGLLKLNLELQPGAAGAYALTVQSGSGNTEFTSPADFSTLLSVAAGSGSLNVAVPEPSSIVLFTALMANIFPRRRLAV
jgi:hypothetical protein